jgi:transposase-like protein
MSELGKFLSHLLPYALGGAAKKVFLRNKKPPEAKVLACYLYLHGPSFRQAKRLLEDLELEVAHSAIWYWFQQLGEAAAVLKPHRKKREFLVVDETEVRTRSGQIFVFSAIDPENRELVALWVSKHRECMDALILLRRALRVCEGKPVLITDGGPWYRWPAQRLGLRHEVVSGGIRNSIERWFETLKDRLRAFDFYFPTRGLRSVENFCHAFRFFYNRCRWHLSFKGPPSGGEGGLKAWMEVLI